MPRTDSLAPELFGSYAETSSSTRHTLEELRRLATSDQDAARTEDWRSRVIQDWALAANAVFKFQFETDRELKRSWYELNGPYDPAVEARLIEGYRALLADSETLLGEIDALEASGRPIEGRAAYAEHVRQAREILEDEAIREKAMAMMPPPAALRALAEAHLRSIGM